MTSVTVVDYGAGNLRSLRAALERLDVDVEVTTRPGDVERAAIVVVPGVGAAGPAMERLETAGLAAAIRAAAERGANILGICLGLQLLFERSEEGDTRCLGLLPGAVRRIDWAETVPHMGWNDVTPAMQSDLFEQASRFYFLHSFYFECADQQHIAAVTRYGIDFASAVHRDNIYGVQFHPEKSQDTGLRLLRNFARLN